MGLALSNRIKQVRFESPAHEAFLNVLVAADHLRTQVGKICEEFGLTNGQYNVLRILRGVYPDGHPRCEIAARMLERAPDVTRLVDRLEAQGLVERDRSELDRRLSITRITPAGLRLLDLMERSFQEMFQTFSAKLSVEDCTNLSTLCEMIYAE
jgi:DNA-binding MarR family transcriptional regulator